MPKLPTNSSDYMDPIGTWNWEHYTGEIVQRDTLCWESYCGCKFTLQADAGYMQWTQCEGHEEKGT